MYWPPQDGTFYPHLLYFKMYYSPPSCPIIRYISITSTNTMLFFSLPQVDNCHALYDDDLSTCLGELIAVAIVSLLIVFHVFILHPI